MKKVGPIGIPIKSDGKCEGGMKKTLKKCMVSCFKGAHLHRGKAISLKRACGRMAGRVCHVASNGNPYFQPAPVLVQLFASRSVNDHVTSHETLFFFNAHRTHHPHPGVLDGWWCRRALLERHAPPGHFASVFSFVLDHDLRDQHALFLICFE